MCSILLYTGGLQKTQTLLLSQVRMWVGNQRIFLGPAAGICCWRSLPSGLLACMKNHVKSRYYKTQITTDNIQACAHSRCSIIFFERQTKMQCRSGWLCSMRVSHHCSSRTEGGSNHGHAPAFAYQKIQFRAQGKQSNNACKDRPVGPLPPDQHTPASWQHRQVSTDERLKASVQTVPCWPSSPQAMLSGRFPGNQEAPRISPKQK